MKSIFSNFYKTFYLRTNGFIPAKPLNQNLFPGDFFQIRNGEIIVLGNIFRKGLMNTEECRLSYGMKLNPVSWAFSDGVTKPYSGRGIGNGPIEGQFEYSKQRLAFNTRGSFFFKGNDPEVIKIMNWSEIQNSLIVKLTQTFYSFRELYLVTESVTTSDWTLAIAGSENGELEIATDAENFGLVDLFGHHSAKTIQSKDIEYYHRDHKRKPVFFAAKKLVVQEEKLNVFVSDLITQREKQNEWVGDFFDYDFEFEPFFHTNYSYEAQSSVLDMLQANELNPNTALLYFRWTDANLDDIQKLFPSHG